MMPVAGFRYPDSFTRGLTPPSMKDDIAVVRLPELFAREGVPESTIALPARDYIPSAAARFAFVAGPSGSAPARPSEIDLTPAGKDENGLDLYRLPSGTAVCTGDSGGAIIARDGESRFLVGVASKVDFANEAENQRARSANWSGCFSGLLRATSTIQHLPWLRREIEAPRP